MKNDIRKSFRDPSGRVFEIDNRIIRVVNKEGQKDLLPFLSSPVTRKLIASQQVVTTTLLSKSSEPDNVNSILRVIEEDIGESIIVEHRKVPYPSFPYEWAPDMLYSAGDLTLDLAIKTLQGGFSLKDASPYNVLFDGTKPLFIDILSFQKRTEGDYTWLPYSQFIRNFVLPLLVNKYFGIPLADVFITRRDGLEPDEVYRLAGKMQVLFPPFLQLVSIPKWLSNRSNDSQRVYDGKRDGNQEKAKFILTSLLRQLKKDWPNRNSNP